MTESPSTPNTAASASPACCATSDCTPDNAQDMRAALHRVADRVSEALQDLPHSGIDMATQARQKVVQQTHHVSEVAQHYIQDKPFKSLMMAAGTGAAVALALDLWLRARKH
jgi:ElaB/YqjD/DUF883 family membrane-anchored ribosome-binding protein